MTDLNTALARLDAWIEREEFRGWDPFDALNSPLLKRLTFGNRRLGQVWVQLLKHSPLNVRPLLGVPKGYNPKGMGLFLATYWRKYRLSGDPAHLARARFFADWLQAHATPGYHGACWGYNFDWPNRGFFAPAGTPTIVGTSFIALAFLDLTGPGAGRVVPGGEGEVVPGALDVARSACEFLLHDLNQLRPAPGELCFSYTPLDRRWVHNAGLLGACVLGEVAARTGETRLAEHALAAARYTARRQRADGAWLYGEGASDGWIDNFHTAFVLVALQRLAACLMNDEFGVTIEKGYRYWKESFFLLDGTPKYYAGEVYPIDAHAVAQAVLTFLAFAPNDPEARAAAERVAQWGIAHMQDRAGYFHYQIHRRYRIRIPYMRWSQAWMQRALTELAAQPRE
jgi:hypothetical protein